MNTLANPTLADAQAPAQPLENAASETAQFPLQSITCTCWTTDDDKDGDTTVGISIDNGTTLMGTADVGGGDHWDDGSTRQFGVPVASAVDYYAAEHGHIGVTITPNGDDEWHFDLEVYMTFAGNGWRRLRWSGLNLAEDRRTANLNW